MRAGLSTIQQTLTPEAASVLNHSIAEAGRRNHGQTTPLHVAATLLASPSGFLRQACIKSHPNSSHPLQCRALELCFSVALERLPTAQTAGGGGGAVAEPPISNALMAALKRAQAHQRRGCPEQQQQPLLAVKVELEQLIISILDDPSVSRVMREASFSSPAVKATIEQSLTTTAAAAAAANASSLASAGNNHHSSVPLGFRPGPTAAVVPSGRNLYLNPLLQQQSQQGGAGAQPGQMRAEEVKRVIDILMRTRKRNPVLVGDSEPEAVVREILRRIEGKELGELMRNVEVVHLEKEVGSERAKMVERVKELAGLVEARIGKSSTGGGVVLNLGDLKWLVEQPVSLGGAAAASQQQQVVSEAGRAAVAEVGKLLAMFGDGGCGGGGSGGGRLWLIGTATCETYLRCQVYHPSMENDWDLQAVPIAARAPVPGLFPRLGVTNGILSSSVESLSPLKGFPAAKLGPPRRLSENLDPISRRTSTTSCCPQCMQSYEQELSKFVARESEKVSSDVKSEGNRPSLPQWLQNAKARDGDVKSLDQTQEQELVLKQKTQELQKKWSETCLHLHPSFHHQPNFSSERIVPTPTGLSMTGLYNPNLPVRQSFQPKPPLNKSLGESLQLNTNPVLNQPSERTNSPPGSPVRTELVLGQMKVNSTNQDQSHQDRIKDLIGCISSEVPQNKLIELQRDDKMASKLDADSFKKLSKGLAEKVWWQPEAAVGVAATMTEYRLGSGKRRGAGSKGDVWVLFLGPDRVGKKRMASALAELVSGSSPVMIYLGSRRGDGEADMSFRGKTVVDRIAEAVRRNPFAVIVLEDINEADMLVRGSMKRAMERGRLADSHGREVSLGNVVFILTADWLPDNLKYLSTNGVSVDEEKLASIAKKAWQLRLLVSGRTAKRRAHWLHDDDQRPTKPRKETNSSLAFDLNEAADTEDDKADGSHNSSDVTIDHEEYSHNRPLLTATSPPPPREMLDSVDDTIVFKPAEFQYLRNGITSTIANRFSNIVGAGVPLEMDEDAVEKILSGLWIGRTSLEAWTENVLVPSFDELKSSFPGSMSDDSVVVRLESDGESDRGGREDFLPCSVKVVVADP